METNQRQPRTSDNKKVVMVNRLPRKPVVAQEVIEAALAHLEQARELLDTAAYIRGDHCDLASERMLGGMQAVCGQHVTALRQLLRGG